MAMLSCVFHTYDKYFAAILNDDDDNGFTIVPQQAKVHALVCRCFFTKIFNECQTPFFYLSMQLVVFM